MKHTKKKRKLGHMEKLVVLFKALNIINVDVNISDGFCLLKC